MDCSPVTAAVVCKEPSGNLSPPTVVSIVPTTVSLDPGVSVPIPTLPSLSSNIVESPMNELLLKPTHFVSRPRVPPPNTGKFGPPAIKSIQALIGPGTPFPGLFPVGAKLNAPGFNMKLNRAGERGSAPTSLGL